MRLLMRVFDALVPKHGVERASDGALALGYPWHLVRKAAATFNREQRVGRELTRRFGRNEGVEARTSSDGGERAKRKFVAIRHSDIPKNGAPRDARHRAPPMYVAVPKSVPRRSEPVPRPKDRSGVGKWVAGRAAAIRAAESDAVPVMSDGAAALLSPGWGGSRKAE